MIKAFIPLRSGSKSIPLKNIKPLNGLPLAQWVINTANSSGLIDEVIVAIDSEQIFSALKNCTAFWRDPQTSTDTAPSESVLLDYCYTQEPDDIIVFIQATSPLSTREELEMGIGKLFEGYDSAISVVRQKRFVWSEDGTPTYDLLNRPRRQDWNGYLVENGAFYISRVKNILESKCRVSGKIALIECSEESYYELDEPPDWTVIESLMRPKETKFPEIDLIVFDFDGVFTDNSVIVSENGEESVRCSRSDGLGLKNLKIPAMVLSTEKNPVVYRRCEKLGIPCVQGCEDKGLGIQKIALEMGVELSKIAFVGNDRNDIPALNLVGFPIVVQDAHPSVLPLAKMVTKNPGGHGAVREVCDLFS